MSRSLRHWPAVFRALRSSQGHARPPRRSRQRPTLRCLPLERLEDRTVPSTITLPVNTLADDPIHSIPGYTTLRDAINQANSHPANNYVISLAVKGTIDLTSPLPDLENNIVLNGLGASNSTVQRVLTASPFRIFTIDTDKTVKISGLTIAQGDVFGNGGGILNSGTLTVRDSTFTGNTVDGNGGGIDNAGTLTVRDSTFTSNFAARPGGNGGGIYNESGGTTTVNDSTFTDNGARFNGGGIFNATGGTLTVRDSTFTSSYATFGGGLFNGGTATVSGSTFTGNSADVGGGIGNTGTLKVRDSTFTSNSADTDGGGIYNTGTLKVRDSTFTSNSAGTDGGGIFNDLGGMLMQNDNIFIDNHPNDVSPHETKYELVG